MRQADLPERIQKIIQSRRLFRRGQSILVAVSGGLDSSVLLHILHQLTKRNGWNLSVAHLNHGLRGRSSDADERLVRNVCEKLGLPIFVARANVRQLAKQNKLSIEMAARKARHEFLTGAAAKKRISTIALAHHADDQVELFFIRLLRGSSGEGLAGMKWRNAFPGAREIEIARPLLNEPKSALREFAARNKIKFREDASNDSLDIMRNRIRHQLLPLLTRDYQPALSKIVLRLMDIAGEEADFARTKAEDWIREVGHSKLARRNQPFSELPVAVQRRCLQLQLLAEAISPDFELIEKTSAQAQHRHFRRPPRVNCPEYIPRSGWVGTLADVRDVRVQQRIPQCVPAGSGWPDDVQRRRHRVGNPGPNGMNLPKHKPGTEYFDAELVGSKVILRHWQKGDRFQPIGMPTAAKLQDLFVNQRVPRQLRHNLVVAESEKGEIFWVEGLRISERFQLTKGTKRRLQWQWRRD